MGTGTLPNKAIWMLAVGVICTLACPARTAAEGPCDIYQAAGTPCVAAHSTVRALYGAYTGHLYQVKRGSDSTTKDIGVLAAGGFANSATQDSFCTGTTCTISIIYDQSGKGNNLTSAPGGGAKAAADLRATATALKLNASGHEVYGVHIPAGVGYRVDKTTGIATGDQAETEYMVTSGTYVNSGCCFDYGNAETDNHDDGSATMEAVYFGTEAYWGKGSGNGPWVMADLENGLWAGSATVTSSNTPLTSTYVTAMVRGNSGNSFALKGGNAAMGTLTTMWNGARPNGYTPMKKQGAIILGIGGDNSNGAQGNFFEGAMTTGSTTDATDNAVQANIVAAGYGSATSSITDRAEVSTPEGLLVLPANASGRLQVVDAQGRSRFVDVVAGQAQLGQLPVGLYHARLLDGSAQGFQKLLILR
jgi:hypothetical protein